MPMAYLFYAPRTLHDSPGEIPEKFTSMFFEYVGWFYANNSARNVEYFTRFRVRVELVSKKASKITCHIINTNYFISYHIISYHIHTININYMK